MNIQDYVTHPFKKFDKDWGLLTAGVQDDFNSMTISWGGMGTLWYKPMLFLFLFVRPTRYTFEFISRHDELTVSFYEEEYRNILANIFGLKSGRDIDKPKEAGLTPIILRDGVTYEEASETLVCRKLFIQPLNKNDFPELALQLYQGDKETNAHHLILAEVIRIES